MSKLKQNNAGYELPKVGCKVSKLIYADRLTLEFSDEANSQLSIDSDFILCFLINLSD